MTSMDFRRRRAVLPSRDGFLMRENPPRAASHTHPRKDTQDTAPMTTETSTGWLTTMRHLSTRCVRVSQTTRGGRVMFCYSCVESL